MVSSSVSAFPLYRRQKLVGGIASVLQSKNGEDATIFWRETAKQLLRQLLSSGVEAAAAEEEVRKLFYTVMDQMHRGAARAGA